jgi:hypothetical protein
MKSIDRCRKKRDLLSSIWFPFSNP